MKKQLLFFLLLLQSAALLPGTNQDDQERLAREGAEAQENYNVLRAHYKEQKEINKRRKEEEDNKKNAVIKITAPAVVAGIIVAAFTLYKSK